MYNQKIVIVIPCYKVKDKILKVLSKIPKWIYKIICIDDLCPENSGKHITSNINDDRIIVLLNKKNLGVGGATMEGFLEAKKHEADLIIKIDGDDQMDLKYLKDFIDPIVNNEADFTKGNRFTKFTDYEKMPLIRKIGNIFLSFFNRFASGYWNIFDTTNGYICLNAKLLNLLPLSKISKDYFFESDLLNWLYIIRANVKDIPIKSIYDNEKSNINIFKIIFKFPIMYIRNFFRRYFYEYCIRNTDYRFLSFVLGFLFTLSGITFSLLNWKTDVNAIPSVPGTVGLAIIFIVLGVYFSSLFFMSDLKNYPTTNLFKI